MLAGPIALLALLQSALAHSTAAPGASVRVVAGPQYQAGWFKTFLFGNGWRSLWLTPINVPVDDLDRGGGLTAYDRGGSGQTLVLRFCTPDGRIYQFRSIDKNPGQLTSGLRRTPPIRWIYRNHISAMFPAAALAVGELEEASGLIPTERWAAVLPDSPRLGKWRDDFKGMLGIFERRLLPSKECPSRTPEAQEVIDSDSLFPRLQADAANLVDERTYLKARLLDLLVNDPDRYADQWAWARVDEGGLHYWEPVPRDRDWALSHNDGFIYALARPFSPSWVKFGPREPDVRGLMVRSESLDRRFLNGLDRPTWDSLVTDLRRRLNDRAIAGAIAKLPAEFDSATTGYLARSLSRRREVLPLAADKFYRRLAQVVDLQTSEQADQVDVTRADDGSVLVHVFGPGKATLLRRRFLPTETREIRLYLLGGADSIQVRGSAKGVPLRVITGGGADLVIDSTNGSALRVYDDSNSTTVLATGTVRRIVRPPETALKRDWGRAVGVAPWFGVRPELGAILGAGPVFTSYGFRKVPYESRVRLRLATTTKAGELNADLRGDLRFERPDRRVVLQAALLNADVIRYFGLGNETRRSATSGFHNVVQQQYFISPVVHLGFAEHARFELGGLLRWSKTDEERTTLLTEERPYGTGSFTEAAASAAAVYDSRDDERLPTRGVTLSLTGRVFPAILDVATAFSTVSLVGTGYFTASSLPFDPTFALRAGAQRVFGSYPFFEAADIGGKETLRGLTTRRYTGDAALYGNSEVRLKFGSWGVLGLADVGRVFREGESSASWRVGLGGGIWIAPRNGRHMLSAIMAGSGERLRLYVNTGFHF